MRTIGLGVLLGFVLLDLAFDLESLGWSRRKSWLFFVSSLRAVAHSMLDGGGFKSCSWYCSGLSSFFLMVVVGNSTAVHKCRDHQTNDVVNGSGK